MRIGDEEIPDYLVRAFLVNTFKETPLGQSDLVQSYVNLPFYLQKIIWDNYVRPFIALNLPHAYPMTDVLQPRGQHPFVGLI